MNERLPWKRLQITGSAYQLDKAAPLVWKTNRHLLTNQSAELREETLVQIPVVASHRVRMELFCARFNQLMASLVLVAHFTMVM